MSNDAKSVWSDPSTWAAIIATLLGLYGAFWIPLIQWLRRPKLKIEFDRIANFSEPSDHAWFLRVSVINDASRIGRIYRSSAQNVEVFLESIAAQDNDGVLELPAYFPIRLVWTHLDSPTCDRIVGGGYRLLDFGNLDFTYRGYSIDQDGRTEFESDPPLLRFQTEQVHSSGSFGLPVGTYVITFLIVSENTFERQSISLTVFDQVFESGRPLAASSNRGSIT